MKIAILGGTGNLGKGLCIRWCKENRVLVGSRSLEKARRLASDYIGIARSFYKGLIRGSLEGFLNVDAARHADLVVLALPYEHVYTALNDVKDGMGKGKIVVSPIVPLKRERGSFTYVPQQSVKSGAVSMAEAIAEKIEGVRVVAAYHTLPAARLAMLTTEIEADTLICGDDQKAVQIVSKLTRQLSKIRPIYVGPLSTSRLVESITPLLLNISAKSGISDPAIRIV